MTILHLHVYLGDSFSFYLDRSARDTCEALRQGVESELNALFELVDSPDPIAVLAIRSSSFYDLPPETLVGDAFENNDVVFVDLDLVKPVSTTSVTIAMITPREGSLMHHAILRTVSEQDKQRIIDESRTSLMNTALQPREVYSADGASPARSQAAFHPGEKCQPYCMPLAEVGDNRSICPVCNEIKAYCAAEGVHCTPYCKSGDTQKSKSNGLQFCSVCMSRYRAGKYLRGAVHQCSQCHRPWLRLNINGVCRTCHCEDETSSHVPFQPYLVTIDTWVDKS